MVVVTQTSVVRLFVFVYVCLLLFLYVQNIDSSYSVCGISNIKKKEGKNMFYLMTHSTHFIYGYVASDI